MHCTRRCVLWRALRPIRRSAEDHSKETSDAEKGAEESCEENVQKERFKKEATGVTGTRRRFSCSCRAYNLTHDYPDKSGGVFKSTSSTHCDLHRPIPRICHPERIGWHLVKCPVGFLGNRRSNAACHRKQSPATRKLLARLHQVEQWEKSPTMRVTFDTNVWNRMVFSERSLDSPKYDSLVRIKKAIRSGRVRGFISEGFATVEAISKRNRAKFHAENIPTVEVTPKVQSGGSISTYNTSQ